MKRLWSLVVAFKLSGSAAFATAPNKYNLLIAPGTLSETSVTLLWDKKYVANSVVYEILLNGKPHGTIGKTNFTII